MHQLTRNNAAQVLDLLTARCVYEREGVQLYDAAIAKIERHGEPRYHAILDYLRHIRREEKEHEEWLEEQIRALGGDPHADTALARLEHEESSGVKNILVDGHNQVSHILHALLAAELADNAGWDLLVKLASDTGDREALKQFSKRLAQEARHLLFMREAVHTAAQIEILGRDKAMPRDLKRALMPRKSSLAVSAATIAGLIGAGWAALRMRRGSRSRHG
jgi:bacterioferritin (cytochrome b1)